MTEGSFLTYEEIDAVFQSEETRRIKFAPIAQDGCRRLGCDLAFGHPIAYSFDEKTRWLVVRYVCPKCRNVWDMGWSMVDVPGLWDGKEPFFDRILDEDEALCYQRREDLFVPVPVQSKWLKHRREVQELREEK